MIRFQMHIENISDYQRGDLPRNAVRLETPAAGDMMKKVLPIMVITCILMQIPLFCRMFFCRDFAVSPLSIAGLAAGFAAGFTMLIVHELLHAAVYPRCAAVTVGKLKGRLMFAALASCPMRRARFFVMCLLPFVLGIIPLVLFLCGAPEHAFLNFFWFGMAAVGMVSPSPDLFNVLTVRRQSRPTDRIQFYEDDIYRISEEE